MKKNLISLAVVASVVGAGSAAVAQQQQLPQYLNTQGKGEVLLFPFYDAENGNATNFHVVNTTDEVKAVKIRFLEYKNSQEVLDFNLYLSAEDHFSFGVIGDPNGTGGAIITQDNSCTVPALGSANNGFDGSTTENADGSVTRIQPFTTFDFANRQDVDDSPERTLRGHVEVIEMGEVQNIGAADDPTRYADFATHGADGVPANCAALNAAWANGGWVAGSVTTPEGGLYGLGYHINVEDAAAWGFEPAAIDDWSVNGTDYHTNPGSLLPSIVNGVPVAHIWDDAAATAFTYLGLTGGRDAVTAHFMTQSIENDVMINPAIGGQTDWVTTFPTKRYYVDVLTNANAPEQPFSDEYIGNNGAPDFEEERSCEVVRIETWDREEAFIAPDNGFSPAPGEQAQIICDEQNTTAWGNPGTLSALNVERDLFNLGFTVGQEGWARWSFNNLGLSGATAQTIAAQANQVLCDGTLQCLRGLPATGFAAYSYANGSMDNVMMNYGHVADHKTNVIRSF